MGYIRELRFYKKLEVYRNLAPVFAYLLAMIAAFLLADKFDLGDVLSYVLYSLSFAFFVLAFQYNRRVFSLCFFFCFSLLYYSYRVDSSTVELPSTELGLKIRLDGVNTRCDRYISGYAKIIDGGGFDEVLKGKELFFVIYGDEAKFDIGTKLSLRSTLSPVDEELSGFDAFLAKRKISYKLVSSDYKVDYLPLGYFEQTLQKCRAYISRNISNSSEEYGRYLPMYRALMIGDMSKVDKADKQKFARSASIHIFAISGLHVGLVASLLLLVFRVMGLRYVSSIILSLVLLYVYVQVCGAKPSAMRAYMMLFFVACAYLFRRKSSSFSALLLSASIALLYEPKNLFNVGFLLSYCVVASIILYGLSLYDYLLKRYKPYAMLPDKFLNFPKRATRRIYIYLLMSFCISYSALLGGGLLCSYFFGYVAWASIINFIIFIPLVSLILLVGFVSLCIPSCLALYFNDFVLLLLKFMTTIAGFFSDANFIVEIKIKSVYILICGLVVLFASMIYLRDRRDLRLIYLPISIFSAVLVLGG